MRIFYNLLQVREPAADVARRLRLTFIFSIFRSFFRVSIPNDPTTISQNNRQRETIKKNVLHKKTLPIKLRATTIRHEPSSQQNSLRNEYFSPWDQEELQKEGEEGGRKKNVFLPRTSPAAPNFHEIPLSSSLLLT